MSTNVAEPNTAQLDSTSQGVSQPTRWLVFYGAVMACFRLPVHAAC